MQHPLLLSQKFIFRIWGRLYRSSLSGKLSYAMRKNRNLSNRPIIAVTNLVTFIKEHPQPNSNSEIVTGVTCSRRGMMRGYLSKVVISQEIRQQQLDDDFLRAETWSDSMIHKRDSISLYVETEVIFLPYFSPFFLPRIVNIIKFWSFETRCFTTAFCLINIFFYASSNGKILRRELFINNTEICWEW